MFVTLARERRLQTDEPSNGSDKIAARSWA
jgi:hypothetical protein